MTGALLLRGMIVGVIAGLAAFLFAATFGEPPVDLAIAFEARMTPPSASAEPPLVSRATQAGLGLAVGLVAFGAALGGMFALVFALAHGRLGLLGARATAALLAGAAFVSTALVPQLKYPANPPAVGFDDTIAARTTLFFVLLALSVACMVAAVMVARRLWRERGGWSAGMIAGAVFIALIGLVFVALPSLNEMPEGFDPQVIWDFRVAALGVHLVLWAVIGLGFGAAAERLLGGARPRRPALI